MCEFPAASAPRRLAIRARARWRVRGSRSARSGMSRSSGIPAPRTRSIPSTRRCRRRGSPHVCPLPAVIAVAPCTPRLGTATGTETSLSIPVPSTALPALHRPVGDERAVEVGAARDRLHAREVHHRAKGPTSRRRGLRHLDLSVPAIPPSTRQCRRSGGARVLVPRALTSAASVSPVTGTGMPGDVAEPGKRYVGAVSEAPRSRRCPSRMRSRLSAPRTRSRSRPRRIRRLRRPPLGEGPKRAPTPPRRAGSRRWSPSTSRSRRPSRRRCAARRRRGRQEKRIDPTRSPRDSSWGTRRSRSPAQYPPAVRDRR